jgi:glycosyltransferase involved in cell wall biosynthesis
MIKTVAIVTWGLGSGAFAHIAAALAKGFLEVGIDNVDIVVLKDDVGPDVSLTASASLHILGSSRAASAVVPLAHYLKERCPDVVISMPWNMNIVTVLGKICSRQHPCLIVMEAGSPIYLSQHEYECDIRMRSYPVIARALYRWADGIVAISRHTYSDTIRMLRSFPVTRTIIIHPPIDVDRVERLSRDAPEHPWLTHKDRPVVVTAGRLEKRKAHSVLVKAFQYVNSVLDARLIIFGEGPLRRTLESLVRELGLKESVSLPGRVQNVIAHIASADVFALSSEEEGFGLVLAEAMACGVPVVSTDCGGARDVLLHEGTACDLLAPVGDPVLLGQKIIEVLSDTHLKVSLINCGRERIRSLLAQCDCQAIS